MTIFKSHGTHIKNIVGRSFIISSIFTLTVALICSLYFNNRGLEIVRQNSLQREQELLSNILVPAIAMSDMMEARRLLSLASDTNEKFAVIDNSGNILMPNYDDLYLVKLVYSSKNTVPDCNGIKTNYRLVNGEKLRINCSSLTENIDKKSVVGILLSFSSYPPTWFSSLVFYFFGIAMISLLLNTLWLRKVLHKKLLTPLTTLGEKIIKIARSPLDSGVYLDGIKNLPYEIMGIKNAFQSLLAHLQTEYSQRTESEKKSALLDQAARVAHDIRSPLAAMEMGLHVIAQDTAKENILLMKMAVQSVRDIANNLLEQYRDSQQEEVLINDSSEISHDDLNITRSVLLYSLIDQIVSQKRHEWLHKSCELSFIFTPTTKSTWINIAPNDVKRMVSNLLNNAIEACGDDAKILVQINKVDQSLEVSIADNGVGTPAEKKEYFLNGESTKHAGKGLGLSGAKKYMESIGGKLTLASEPYVGTTVTLIFFI